MTTEDEALEATREGLRSAGVQLDSEGRVVPVSGHLDAIAKDGGGFITAEQAVAWSMQVQAGEQAVLSFARELVDITRMARAVPGLAGVLYETFAATATSNLATVVPQFIYGASTEVVREAAAPLLEFRADEVPPLEGDGS